MSEESAQQQVEQPEVEAEQAETQAVADGDKPIALVKGEAVVELPQDLYIPPEALEVFLEAFEGPLDLLLYFIKKQNMDILDIEIAHITRQYMEYIDMMQELKLELAAEYLLMAAMLAEIKSRMLLPRQDELEEDEGDPRAELIRRLQEYERFKTAAEKLDELPRIDRDIFVIMGFINVYVVYNFSTNFWVNFKLFGTLILTFIFVVIQGLFMAKHIQHKPAENK